MLYLGPLISANHRESETTSEFIRDDSRQFAGKTLNLLKRWHILTEKGAVFTRMRTLFPL